MNRVQRRPRLMLSFPLGMLGTSVNASESRPVGKAWIGAGVLVGGLVGVACFAPAAWVADRVAGATRGRLLLSEVEGTVWQGSGLPVLTGGPGARDAAVLPSRLHWRVAPFWGGMRALLDQACCLDGTLTLEWHPGWQSQRWAVLSAGATLGHWPAAWLEGLGAPLNTLRTGGELQLSTQSLAVVSGADGLHWQGQAQLDLLQASSRLATVDPLGSYRVSLMSTGHGPMAMTLRTLDGALRLTGEGQVSPTGLQFHGEAQAAPGFEAALNNLLNIIGRRNGALSAISIG